MRNCFPNSAKLRPKKRTTAALCMYVCMYGHHIIAEYGSTGQGCQSCSWSAEQGKMKIFLSLSRLRIWSREMGPSIPSRASLVILHTQAESGAYSRDSSRFPRQRPFTHTTIHNRVSLEFIGSRTSVPMAFTVESPPAQGQYPQGSSSNGGFLYRSP